MTGIATRPDITITETAWQPNTSLGFEEWVQQGKQLGVMGRACQWWIGDWVNYGEHQYGEKYAQAVDETGLDVQTLMNYAWVAGSVPPHLRTERLSWTHHRHVAGLPPDQQRQLLDTAAEAGLPEAKFGQLVKTTQQQAGGPPLEMLEFTTVLTVRHRAPDGTGADDWARRVAARLEAQGASVTHHTTPG